MRKVIWGTGMYASKFVQTLNKNDIAFYIDKDRKKSGNVFYGKKIVHPDDVGRWDDLYVYVPVNYYEEITETLKAHGLEKENYTKYYETNAVSLKASEEDFERAIQELNSNKECMSDKCLFMGYALNIVRGYNEYVHQWREKDTNIDMALVSEAVWIDKEETEIQTGLKTVVAPKMFDYNLYVKDGFLTADEKLKLYNIIGWKDDVEQVKGCFQDISDESAEYMVLRMYQYVEEMLNILTPRTIIIHASVQVYHKIASELCEKYNIPYVFTHQGILPGTFAFDIGGEVGASLPAVYADKFKNLPVTENDIINGQKVWDYLYKTKMNRKIQPNNHMGEVIDKQINHQRPTVFFGGQNDINSHMLPYTQYTQEYHSPIFGSSIEAAVYIANICKQNDWNFVYKPHPMYAEREDVSLLPDNTIYVKYGDINELIDGCDVFVTILSTANYVGLIRKKPVVMLGYTQSKGKNITYEAFEKNKIEQAIKDAIDNGFTKEQQEAFAVHLAQVLKYYLYDDMTERELRFGKPIPESIDELWDLERLLKTNMEEENHVL
jgi:hypothetical protein